MAKNTGDAVKCLGGIGGDRGDPGAVGGVGKTGGDLGGHQGVKNDGQEVRELVGVRCAGMGDCDGVMPWGELRDRLGTRGCRGDHYGGSRDRECI